MDSKQVEAIQHETARLKLRLEYSTQELIAGFANATESIESFNMAISNLVEAQEHIDHAIAKIPNK